MDDNVNFFLNEGRPQKQVCNQKQAGMSCAQPQAEAVSLLNIYIRPLVAEIFSLSLGSNLDKIGLGVAQTFLLFIIEVVFLGKSSLVGGISFKFGEDQRY
jgi:hypothetical protein